MINIENKKVNHIFSFESLKICNKLIDTDKEVIDMCNYRMQYEILIQAIYCIKSLKISEQCKFAKRFKVLLSEYKNTTNKLTNKQRFRWFMFIMYFNVLGLKK